jgi:hypothetical protein
MGVSNSNPGLHLLSSVDARQRGVMRRVLG